MTRMTASQTSAMLCGGMLVAIPTAMPLEPFTSRFGNKQQNNRFQPIIVIRRHKVDSFTIDVPHHFGGSTGKTCFGVSHGGWRQTGERSEVALFVDINTSRITQSWAIRTSVG